MARDNSNVPLTCPFIDEVLSLIDIEFDCNDSEERVCADKIAKASMIMETIRTANSDLREWGNEIYKEKEDVEGDREYYQQKLEVAEEQIRDYKKEIDALGTQVSLLEIELENNYGT